MSQGFIFVSVTGVSSGISERITVPSNVCTQKERDREVLSLSFSDAKKSLADSCMPSFSNVVCMQRDHLPFSIRCGAAAIPSDAMWTAGTFLSGVLIYWIYTIIEKKIILVTDHRLETTRGDENALI